MNSFKVILRLVSIVLIVSYLKLDILLRKRSFLWLFRCIASMHPKYRKIEQPKFRAEALRVAFTELGPIFIKLGQTISIRPDLFPIDIVKEFTKLQDRVNPFPANIAKDIIEYSLQDKITNIFSDFEDQPIASASIAQVHGAKTRTGQSVVIKVLRPNIKKEINKDIIVMRFMAKAISVVFKQSRRFRLLEVVNELEKTLYHEIDLAREAANAAELRRNFKNSKQLYIPEIYWQWTKKSVLVMEKIEGIPITNIEKLKSHNINIKKLAETGVEIFFTQVFRDRFFHADMHPGNIFVSYKHPDTPKYIAVDFGIVGYLDVRDQTYLANIFLAFFNRDFYQVAYLHKQVGWLEHEVNLADFADEIRILSEPIFDKPLKDISFGHLLLKLLQVGQKFNMHVQPHLLLFQKTLFAIEGLGKELYPELNIWNIAKPYLEKWQRETLFNKFDPLKNSSALLELFTILPKLPVLLHDTLNCINEDKYIKKNHINKKSNYSFKKITYFIFGFGLAIAISASIRFI